MMSPFKINESSLPVLSHDTIYCSKFWRTKFGNLVEICLWPRLAVKGLKKLMRFLTTRRLKNWLGFS